MFLHHLVTIFLYAASYMMNFTKIGSLIMFLHDCGDIFMKISKIFVETNFKKSTVIIAIWTWLFWNYSRLYVFPQIIWYGVYEYPSQNPPIGIENY